MPQVVDMNNDGYEDIVAGSYTGEIVIYKGSKDGFEPREILNQTTNVKDNKTFMDYLFTDVTLGDFNGNGVLDAFVGGVPGARVMINEGTNENPLFGARTAMYRNDGSIVTSVDFTQEDLDKVKGDVTKLKSKDFKSYVRFLDWDNDGVNDLIVTSGYYYPGADAVLFYKGIKTDKGLIFDAPISLFTLPDHSKALPGSILVPYICDINKDGKLDLLLGVSMNYDVENHLFNDKKEYQMGYGEEFDKQMEELEEKYGNPSNYEIYKKKVAELYKNAEEKLRIPEQTKEPKYKSSGVVIVFYGK